MAERLDLDTGLAPAASIEPAPAARIEARLYDPTPDRERVRGFIAGAMTALFVTVIVSLLFYALLNRDLETVTKLAALILTPVSGLLGAVVGFYYGEQSGRR